MDADTIAYAGGILIMLSFIPQVIKSWQTRSVKDLSAWMIAATFLGTCFWVYYGLLVRSTPIMVMNSLFGITVLAQLYLKIKYDAPRKKRV